jgi:sugar phosphate isomerase/epimerase
LGQDEIDIIGCLKVLKDSGYQGVLSYGTEGFEEPEEAFEIIFDSKKFLDNTLKNL